MRNFHIKKTFLCWASALLRVLTYLHGTIKQWTVTAHTPLQFLDFDLLLSRVHGQWSALSLLEAHRLLSFVVELCSCKYTILAWTWWDCQAIMAWRCKMYRGPIRIFDRKLHTWFSLWKCIQRSGKCLLYQSIIYMSTRDCPSLLVSMSKTTLSCHPIVIKSERRRQRRGPSKLETAMITEDSPSRLWTTVND